MAQIRIDGDDLVVEIEGLDKLWTFRGSLVIPLTNVRGATADPGMAGEPKGWRGPGAHVPGVIIAGTYHRDGELVFWDVRDVTKAVVIELAGERYTRLVVEVADPRATVIRIEQAIAGRA